MLGGWGGTLIFSYICSGQILGFKILNFNIFCGCQKNKHFFGYEDFVDIFLGVITKLGSSYLPTTTVNKRQQPSTTDNKLTNTDNKFFRRYFQIKQDFYASLSLKRLYKVRL